MSSGRQLIPPLLPLLLSLSRAAPPPTTTPTTTTSTTTTTTHRPILSWQNLQQRPALQLLQSLGNLPQRPLTIQRPENPSRPLQTIQNAIQNFQNQGTRQRRSTDTSPTQSPRQEKALQYFQYDFPETVPGGYLAVSADDPAAAAAAAAGDLVALDIDGELLEGATDANGNELVSRANPPYRKHNGNSPIYYIRLPPAPYVFVPGLGYVSQTQTNRQPVAARPPPPASPFINLPLTFVSNGKPTGVYQPAWAPQRPVRPPPPPPPPPRPSPIFNLDKGPYLFNGRPTDLFVLRDTYDALYADALQNLYP